MLIIIWGHLELATKIEVFNPHSYFACYKQAHTQTMVDTNHDQGCLTTFSTNEQEQAN